MAAPASPPDHKDFWISYNKADSAWAEWAAWHLEAAGYTTVLQAWDFRPGSNFVLEMQKAAESAGRTIAILSPDYLQASFPQAEWAAAFAADPAGALGRLLPFRVRDCEPKGLLGPVIYSDFVGLEEAAAREQLLGAVQRGRAKPAEPPPFPVPIAASPAAPPFPGPARRHSATPATASGSRPARRSRSTRSTPGGTQLALLPLTEELDAISADASTILGLLASCDSAGPGLPRPVVATALGLPEAAVAPVLAPLIEARQVTDADGLTTLVAPDEAIPAASPEVCARGLDALLASIGPRRGDGL